MKASIMALAVSLTLGAFAQPASAQDATPAVAPPAAEPVAPVDNTATDPNQKKKAGPMLSKPVPRRQVPDTAVVIGGIAGGLAVIAAVAGGGGGDDNPSSP